MVIIKILFEINVFPALAMCWEQLSECDLWRLFWATQCTELSLYGQNIFAEFKLVKQNIASQQITSLSFSVFGEVAIYGVNYRQAITFDSHILPKLFDS